MGGGSFSRNGKGGKNTSVIFSLKDGVGALAEALKVFKVNEYDNSEGVRNLIFRHFRHMVSTWLISNLGPPRGPKMPTSL